LETIDLSKFPKNTKINLFVSGRSIQERPQRPQQITGESLQWFLGSDSALQLVSVAAASPTNLAHL
jgi:hypothetical protein